MRKYIAAKLSEESERPVNDFQQGLYELISIAYSGSFSLNRPAAIRPYRYDLLIPCDYSDLAGSDPGADRPQQKRRKMRMIGGLQAGIALHRRGFGTADRRRAGGRRIAGRGE